jgi:hypothetical protein
MSGKNSRPFAFTVVCDPIAIDFALRPCATFRNLQEHLTRIQKADERPERARKSAKNENFFSLFRLLLYVSYRSQNCRMVEQDIPTARE